MATPAQAPSSAFSTQELDFLQRRLALFGGVTSALTFAFLLIKCVRAIFSARDPSMILSPGFTWHALGAVGFGVIWLGTRGEARRSKRALEIIEIAGLLIACTALAAQTFTIPLMGSPSFVLTLILTYAFMTRATLVPSNPRRTAVMTFLAGIPLVAFDYTRMTSGRSYLEYVLKMPEMGPAFAREYFSTNPDELAFSLAFFTGVWWMLTTTLATITSHVIYGLRREVKKAQRLGQYELIEKLGEGGMGAVYRAEHAMLKRPTAVKLLLPDLAGDANILRFEREVQLTSKLTHPNTVTIFDYGRTSDGVFYYAMELLEGLNLEQLVEIDGPQPPSRVVHVLTQVAGALTEAHGVGLIHRDVKPANIILCERGGMRDVTKIVDFGLVKAIGDAPGAGVSNQNVVAGTPLYMSPETINAPETVDAKSDLYSLGAVGYFLLTGHHVFTGKTPVEVCSHHLHTQPIPPSQRGSRVIPPALERTILSCLAKDRASRPESAAALARELAASEVPPWTADDARLWWARNGARVRERFTAKATPASASHRTILAAPR